MTLRCAVLDDYQGVALSCADWTQLDDVEVTVFRERLPDEAAVAEALAGFDIVVIMRERTPFPATLLARLPGLRLLVTTGPHNAVIDLAAAAEQGVTVCGTGSGSRPPAELTWALILGLARHLTQEAGSLRSAASWQSTLGTDLYGATLGLVGLGKIGSQVARVGLAFGMDVAAWSPHLTSERAAEVGVRAVTKQQLFGESDFVSIHLILGRSSRHIVSRTDLAAMKPTAYFVNTSRAGLVDSTALLDTLRAGRIAGAGLDVFDEEPLPGDDELRRLPNVLATPHLGYVTRHNYEGYYREAVEDIAAFIAGAPIRTL
jgi:phosphoglycerate dehydrogenase-like enzyme